MNATCPSTVSTTESPSTNSSLLSPSARLVPAQAAVSHQNAPCQFCTHFRIEIRYHAVTGWHCDRRACRIKVWYPAWTSPISNTDHTGSTGAQIVL
jgi:hypothetical protein